MHCVNLVQPVGFTASCAELQLPLSYTGEVEGNITYFVKRVRGPGAPATPTAQLWLCTSLVGADLLSSWGVGVPVATRLC